MSGIKGRSGRKSMEIELKRKERKLMELDYLAKDVIKEALENGDKNIAMYVYDHNHGKAKHSIESKSLNVAITGEQLLELQKQWELELAQDEKLLLSESTSMPFIEPQ